MVASVSDLTEELLVYLKTRLGRLAADRTCRLIMDALLTELVRAGMDFERQAYREAGKADRGGESEVIRDVRLGAVLIYFNQYTEGVNK